jgi:hypothetical protein
MISASIWTVLADNMTAVGPFVFLTGLATALIGYIVYALRSGGIVSPPSRAGSPSCKYARDKEPIFYWVYVVMYAFLAGGFIYGASKLDHKWIGELFSK